MYFAGNLTDLTPSRHSMSHREIVDSCKRYNLIFKEFKLGKPKKLLENEFQRIYM